MATMIRRAAVSLWLWLAVVLIGGCALTEGMRQAAQVEESRALQQQQRTDEMQTILGEVQDALSAVAAAIPGEEAQPIRDTLARAQDAVGMVVERAISVHAGAQRSEEWAEATGNVVGPPERQIRPDTPEEDHARADFRRRARVIARVRQARENLSNVMGGRPSVGGSASAAGNGLGVIGGIAAILLGGGGLTAALGRRARKRLQQTFESSNEEHNQHDQDRDKDIREMQEQVVTLTNAVERMHQQLTETTAGATPSLMPSGRPVPTAEEMLPDLSPPSPQA